MLGYGTQFAADISIHVPRGGHDRGCRTARPVHTDFNPRAPWGARRSSETPSSSTSQFQSTCPVGGTTGRKAIKISEISSFQSTCPVGGTTSLVNLRLKGLLYFNPRAPWGARPQKLGMSATAYQISIHVPRGGHDSKSVQKTSWCLYAFGKTRDNARQFFGSQYFFMEKHPLPYGAKHSDRICPLYLRTAVRPSAHPADHTTLSPRSA